MSAYLQQCRFKPVFNVVSLEDSKDVSQAMEVTYCLTKFRAIFFQNFLSAKQFEHVQY